MVVVFLLDRGLKGFYTVVKSGKKWEKKCPVFMVNIIIPWILKAEP